MCIRKQDNSQCSEMIICIILCTLPPLSGLIIILSALEAIEAVITVFTLQIEGIWRRLNVLCPPHVLKLEELKMFSYVSLSGLPVTQEPSPKYKMERQRVSIL